MYLTSLQLGVILKKLDMHNKQFSFVDKVTEMNNQNFFVESATVILQLAKRHKISSSVAIIDIDNLKELNDKYGYAIVNKFIKTIADTLKEKCRKCDLLCYLGEGRFGLLLYDISGINTDMSLNTIRKTIEYNRYSIEKYEFNVTVSIGATVVYMQMNEEALESIYDRAYLATNEAKGKGKNCVVIY